MQYWPVRENFNFLASNNKCLIPDKRRTSSHMDSTPTALRPSLNSTTTSLSSLTSGTRTLTVRKWTQRDWRSCLACIASSFCWVERTKRSSRTKLYRNYKEMRNHFVTRCSFPLLLTSCWTWISWLYSEISCYTRRFWPSLAGWDPSGPNGVQKIWKHFLDQCFMLIPDLNSFLVVSHINTLKNGTEDMARSML